MNRRHSKILASLATAAVLLLGAGRADAAPPEVAAADRAQAALEAKDKRTLRAFARGTQPDPWLLVEELCHRKAFEAAQALARAADGRSRKALLGYIKAREEKPAADAVRARWHALEDALRRRDGEAARKAAAQAVGTLDSVFAVQVAHHRGSALFSLGERIPGAQELDRAGRAALALGWDAMAYAALKGAGMRFYRVGQLRAAADSFVATLPIVQVVASQEERANMHTTLGVLYVQLGDYSDALRQMGLARGLFEDLEDEVGLAGVLNNAGHLHYNIGDFEKAAEHYERALELARANEDDAGTARVLQALGNCYLHEDPEKGRAYYEQALALQRELGDRAGEARTIANLGGLATEAKDYPQAIKHLEEAAQILESLDAWDGLDAIGYNLASIYILAGDLDQAAKQLALTQAVADQIGSVRSRVTGPKIRAWLHAERKEWAEAIKAAREGILAASQLADGLGDVQGAGARESWTELFEHGVRASLELESAEDMLFFIEHVRAGSLRDRLNAQGALKNLVIPHALASRLAAAQQTEAAALQAFRTAQRSSRLKQLRAAKQAMQDARAGVLEAVVEIQRSARAGASVLLPQADSLEDIRARLAPGDALVYYALTENVACALVVRKDAARTVALPAPVTIEAAVAKTLLEEAPYVEPKGVPALRKALIEPLGLKDDVTRVLISPMGRLGYLPFCLLLPKRDVAYAPSGTTLGLLDGEKRKRGKGVLGLGDPKYPREKSSWGVKLAPLPATRAEIDAVATDKLLGERANELALLEALPRQKRWRAVHFACHGLIDAEQPLLSALALTPWAGGDGMLNCLDVFRAKIPADLVTLSACETAKGRVFRIEGIVGLTRAFIFAGSPRVLCSLWKVDDEATQALMIEFYRLWNPAPQALSEQGESNGGKGLSAAEALRQAQAFIRKQPQWEHPTFWAPWVLWGLAD